MKTIPRSAAKTRLIEALAPENRRLRKSAMSSIGWVVRRSQATNAATNSVPSANPARMDAATPAPFGHLDDRPDDGGEAEDRQAGTDRVEPPTSGVPGLGDQPEAGDERDGDHRDIDPED